MISMNYCRYNEWILWRDSRGVLHQHKRGNLSRVTRKKNQRLVTKMVRTVLTPSIEYVTAEALSRDLKINIQQIKRVIVKLQSEGVLSPPVNLAPHDSPRNPVFYGEDSAWRATTYRNLHAK